MHWDILDAPRKKILPHLAFAKSYGFYLAGGTGLALQLGHRTPVDFYFYTKGKFDEMVFEERLRENVKGIQISQRGWQTLFGEIGSISLSFFYYSYPLLDSLVETEHLNVVSIPDIAAMKLIAISQRGLKRDFLDLYVVAKKHGLDKIFTWTKKKFSQFDPMVHLTSLTYFEDAEKDKSGRGLDLKKPVPWSQVKTFFVQETNRLTKIWL